MYPRLKKALTIVNVSGIILFIIGLIILGLSFIIPNSYKFDYEKFKSTYDARNAVIAPYINKTIVYGSTEYNKLAQLVYDNADPMTIPYKNVDTAKASRSAEYGDTILIRPDTINVNAFNELKKIGNRTYHSEDTLDSLIISSLGNNIDLYSISYNSFYKFTDVQSKMIPVAIFFICGIIFTVVTFPIIYFLNQQNHQQNVDQKIKDAKILSEANPKAIMPAWDLAQITLEEYYKRNLAQINMIFWISVAVMIIGFILIATGIIVAFNNPAQNFIPIVSASSGILTEFIGATFIFIYNSTIKQAIGFTGSLEKTTTVGMSMKILDSINKENADPNGAQNLINAKIEISKILISQSNNQA